MNAEKYSENAFAVCVKVDSPKLDFLHGDIIIVDPEVEPRPGDVVLVGIGEIWRMFLRFDERAHASAQAVAIAAGFPDYSPYIMGLRS